MICADFGSTHCGDAASAVRIAPTTGVLTFDRTNLNLGASNGLIYRVEVMAYADMDRTQPLNSVARSFFEFRLVTTVTQGQSGQTNRPAFFFSVPSGGQGTASWDNLSPMNTFYFRALPGSSWTIPAFIKTGVTVSSVTVANLPIWAQLNFSQQSPPMNPTGLTLTPPSTAAAIVGISSSPLIQNVTISGVQVVAPSTTSVSFNQSLTLQMGTKATWDGDTSGLSAEVGTIWTKTFRFEARGEPFVTAVPCQVIGPPGTVVVSAPGDSQVECTVSYTPSAVGSPNIDVFALTQPVGMMGFQPLESEHAVLQLQVLEAVNPPAIAECSRDHVDACHSPESCFLVSGLWDGNGSCAPEAADSPLKYQVADSPMSASSEYFATWSDSGLTLEPKATIPGALYTHENVTLPTCVEVASDFSTTGKLSLKPAALGECGANATILVTRTVNGLSPVSVTLDLENSASSPALSCSDEYNEVCKVWRGLPKHSGQTVTTGFDWISAKTPAAWKSTILGSTGAPAAGENVTVLAPGSSAWGMPSLFKVNSAQAVASWNRLILEPGSQFEVQATPEAGMDPLLELTNISGNSLLLKSDVSGSGATASMRVVGTVQVNGFVLVADGSLLTVESRLITRGGAMAHGSSVTGGIRGAGVLQLGDGTCSSGSPCNGLFVAGNLPAHVEVAPYANVSTDLSGARIQLLPVTFPVMSNPGAGFLTQLFIGSGGSLKVQPGHQLIVPGNVIVDGALQLAPDNGSSGSLALLGASYRDAIWGDPNLAGFSRVGSPCQFMPSILSSSSIEIQVSCGTLAGSIELDGTYSCTLVGGFWDGTEGTCSGPLASQWSSCSQTITESWEGDSFVGECLQVVSGSVQGPGGTCSGDMDNSGTCYTNSGADLAAQCAAAGGTWEANFCQLSNACPGGQTWDGDGCGCPSGTHWDSQSLYCLSDGPAPYDDISCQSTSGLYFYWNLNNSTCEYCDTSSGSYSWNTGSFTCDSTAF